MKRLLVVILAVALAIPALAVAGDAVLLKSRTLQGASSPLPWTTLAPYVGRHVLVQLAVTPTRGERDDLAADGLHLLQPIPDRAYFAYVETRDWGAIKAPAQLTMAMELEPEDKMHPRLVTGQVDAYLFDGDGNVLLLVKFHGDVTLKAQQELLTGVGADVVQHLPELSLAYVAMPAVEDAHWLAERDAVEYVTLPEPAWEARNDKVRRVMRAEVAWDEPYSVDGSSVTAMVYDAGAVPMQGNQSKHPDLAGRLTRGPNSMQEFGIYHATHVACTIGGSGQLSGGTYAGIAPGANIISMDLTTGSYSPTNFPFVQNSGDIDMSYRAAIEDYGVQTANNSIGANLGANQPVTKCDWMGDYTITAALIDEIVRGRHGAPITIVWANGNEVGSGCSDGFYSTPPPSPAKNTISVGATSSIDESIAPFSSLGPVDDGRIRPDVSAPGYESFILGTKSCGFGLFGGDPSYQDMSGTSMAAPAVTGATALLFDYWNKEIGGDDPHPALVKALVIHGAVDLGPNGPDFVYGYGGLRIPPMLDLIAAGTFEALELDQGDQYEQAFTHDGKGQVKVTLVWTDPAGAPQAQKALVNNLNMKLVGPGGAETFPWKLNPQAPAQPATRGVDNLNPVEQVQIKNAAAGTYTVVIKGVNVPQGPQDAYFVYEGLTLAVGDDDDTTDDDDVDDDAVDDDDVTDDDTIDDDDDANDDDSDASDTDDDDDNDEGGCGC